MRPGNRHSSVPNCSAITSGAWLGSMIPPAPTRMAEVPAATAAITTAVAALATPGGGAGGHGGDPARRRGAGHAGEVVMLGQPVALVAPSLGVAGEVERVPQG